MTPPPPPTTWTWPAPLLARAAARGTRSTRRGRPGRTTDRDALHVLLDGGVDDLLDRAVVPEVDRPRRPGVCRIRRMMLIDASCPSNRLRRGDEPDVVGRLVQVALRCVRHAKIVGLPTNGRQRVRDLRWRHECADQRGRRRGRPERRGRRGRRRRRGGVGPRLRPDRPGARAVGRAGLGPGRRRHGRHHLADAGAPDRPRPGRGDAQAARRDLRPLRGAHAPLVQPARVAADEGHRQPPAGASDERHQRGRPARGRRARDALDAPRGPAGHARGPDADGARARRAGHQGAQHRGVRAAGPRRQRTCAPSSTC